MPRKITAEMPLDEVESDIIFTQAALAADDDSADLVAVTASWLDDLDAMAAIQRDMRKQVLSVDGARSVADARLDAVCTEFAAHLLLDSGNDRNSTRFKQYVGGPVSVFIRQGLARQVERVKAWLAQGTDPVLERFREPLQKWSGKAERALEQTAGTALVRGRARIAREEFAARLTAERDGLREALAARARERKLPRTWPDAFFRTESRPTAPASAEGGGDTPTG